MKSHRRVYVYALMDCAFSAYAHMCIHGGFSSFLMPPLDKLFPMEVVPDRNEILIKAPDKSVIPEILRRRLEGGGKGVGKDGKKGALALETKAKGNVKGQAKASAPSTGKGKGKTYAKANAEGKWSDW